LNRSVFVTGGSRGIGAAIVRKFAEEGDCVTFTYRQNADAANALAAELMGLGFSVQAICADAADEAQTNNALLQAEKRFGPVRVLVCNAGISKIALLQDTTSADYDAIMNTTVKGCFLATKGVIPQMLKQGNGRILCISSMWGEVGASCEAVYSAAKGAMNAFCKALAKELGPSNITVNAVAPGVIQTDMNAHLSDEVLAELKEETPLGRIGQCEEIADAVFFLTSDSAKFITGQILGVNGGFVI